MAITINTQPQRVQTVYNQIIVVATSTNISEDSFSYIFEICDSSGTTLRTLRIPPEINYSKGVTDVARVLESYLGTDFFKTNGTSDFRDCNNSHYDYQIKVGEEYEVAGVLTQFLDLANFNASAINGSLIFEDFINFQSSSIELDGPAKQFLTEDIDKEVLLSQEGYTHFYNDTAPTDFEVNTYNSSGTLLSTGTFTNAASTNVSSFGSAPTSLNSMTLATGSQPLIDSNTSYYEITAQNAGDVSKTYRYNIKSNCGDGVVLHFLNNLGGFDWFPFLTYKESFGIERETYKKNPNRLAADGSYNFSTLDREVTQYHTKKTRKAKLNTDYLSDSQYEWLIQLVDSPEVYMEKDGVFYSMLI